MLINYLRQIPDPRRGQGRMFDLPHILLFSILAIASGADSYRKIDIFIQGNFNLLCDTYHIAWIRPPSYNVIRRVVHALDTKITEKVFRAYSREATQTEKKKWQSVSLDGKALKHSFDTLVDKRFAQILSAFSPECNIVLAHQSIGTDKNNEINAAIQLMKELQLDHVIYTLDALHTQKKR